MIKKEVVTLLQSQINIEFYSAYLYFAMSSWACSNNLNGIANWLTVQAKEEQSHALEIHRFLLSRGEYSPMKAIEEPKNEWADLEDLFKQVVEHEQKITGMINDIADVALKNKDHATYQFMLKFVAEQVEEEDNANNMLCKSKVAKNSPSVMFSLDRQASERRFETSH